MISPTKVCSEPQCGASLPQGMESCPACGCPVDVVEATIVGETAGENTVMPEPIIVSAIISSSVRTHYATEISSSETNTAATFNELRCSEPQCNSVLPSGSKNCPECGCPALNEGTSERSTIQSSLEGAICSEPECSSAVPAGKLECPNCGCPVVARVPMMNTTLKDTQAKVPPILNPPQVETGNPQMANVCDRLLAEVSNATKTLRELERHRDRIGNDLVQAALEVVADTARRLGRKELYVVVVGEKKVGKSTFLNAILGRTLLSTAVRECTGSVTFIRRGEDIDFQANFENGSVTNLVNAFPDRRNQFDMAIDKANKQLNQLLAAKTSLPSRLKAMQESTSTALYDLGHLRDQLFTIESKYAELCRDLGQKETEHKAFEEANRDAGKAIPYIFRHPAGKMNLVRIVGQKLQAKKAKPEWLEHIEKCKQFVEDSKQLKSLRKVVQETHQHQQAGRQRIADLERIISSLDNQMRTNERKIADLPPWIEIRRKRLDRLSAGRDSYALKRDEAFSQAIKQYTDQEKKGSQVRRLDIQIPSQSLPPDVVVIDTPGVNTDNEQNRNRAWETIRREADGCIVLSDIQQSVSQSTRDFVLEIKNYLPHLILVLTKLDRALESVVLDGSAQAEIDEARLVGERRFAQAVGRAPGEILSFAVSAECALKNDDAVAAARFANDLQSITHILRNERALIVATRCAKTIVTCQAQVASVHSQAERAYAKTIAELESNRIPDPNAFCRQQLRHFDEMMDELGEELAKLGVAVLNRQYRELADACVKSIMECSSTDQLKATVAAFDSKMNSWTKGIHKEAADMVSRQAGKAITNYEEPLLQALRERYQIVQRITGSAEGRANSSKLGLRNSGADIGISVTGIVEDFQKMQIGGVFGGAAAGAIVGSVLPGLGTIVGGLIGGALGALFGPSLEKVKYEVAVNYERALGTCAGRAARQMQDSGSSISRSLKDCLNEGLKKAVRRYGTWIEDLIKSEQNRIASEKLRLAHLVAIKDRMTSHHKNLEALIDLAQKQSRGMVK